MAMIDQVRFRMWACLLLLAGLLLASLLLVGGATQTARADISAAPASAPANQRTDFVQFAAGGTFTCALTGAGAVQCWGDNVHGQLGNGTNNPSVEPVQVIGLESGVTAITAGWSHVCALRADGTAACWGLGNFGQLGQSTAQFDENRPLAVLGISEKIVQIKAGEFHTCAMTESGKLFCWGSNSHGQIGADLGDQNRVSQPTLVAALTDPVADINVGSRHSCALATNNQLYCWGYNVFGQLGDGTKEHSPVPVAVSGLDDVAAIAAGTYHTCALSAAGGVRCWGHNSDGQLGDGGGDSSVLPVDVFGLSSGVTELASGGDTTCARLTDGGATCWGSNKFGQLGSAPTLGSISPLPERIEGAGAITVLSVGYHHTCAVADGEAKCWGSNRQSQLGSGQPAYQPQAITVSGLAGTVVGVAAGTGHSCAREEDGSIQCWGWNEYGQHGSGQLLDSSIPVNVIGLNGAATTIAAGGRHTCATTDNNVAACWGLNSTGQLGTEASRHFSPLPSAVENITGTISSFALGGESTCGLTDQGGVICWGRNSSGQLGTGTTALSADPATIAGLENGVISLSAGRLHTCAVKENNSAVCWGKNTVGQLGDGTSDDRLEPVAVIGLASGLQAISVGTSHSCGLTVENSVVCWGTSGSDQLATNQSSTVPVPINGLLNNVTAISAGDRHTCALLNDGSVKCWGENEFGRLGDGTTARRTVPMSVQGLTGAATAISAGGSHTCALIADGSVQCWGRDEYGQLGNGRMLQSVEPLAVSTGDAPSPQPDPVTCSGALEVGDSVECTWNPGDGILEYTFEAQDGDYITSTYLDDAPFGHDREISIFHEGSEDLIYCKPSTISDAITLSRCEIRATGLHKVRMNFGDYGSPFSYRFWLRQSNERTDSSPLAYGDTVTGTFQSDFHVNVYEFEGKKDDVVYVNLIEETLSRSGRWLNIYNTVDWRRANSECSDIGSDDRIQIEDCVLPGNGTYQLWVYDNEFDDSGEYTLSIACSGGPCIDAEPTVEPTATPGATVAPTAEPTATPEPTVAPTATPTATPEPTATPTATPEPTATPTATPEPTVEPTAEARDGKPLVLIYAVLDNNLGDDTDTWERLINNAEDGAHDDVNVRLLIDGPGDNDSYIYAVEADDNPFCPSVTNPRCNDRYVQGENFWLASEDTAHPETIYNFLVSGLAAHPDASNYIVSLIGHGSGWSANFLAGQPSGWRDLSDDRVGGMLWDDNPGNGNETTRSLSTKMLGAALRQARIDTGRPVDLLYLDACSMAMAEVVYELKENVRYLLASPNIAWASFAYDALIQETYSDQSTKAAGLAWLAAEANVLRSNDGHPFTLALFDLTHLDALATAVSTFGDSLRNVLEQHQEQIQSAYDLTEKFESDYNGAIESNSDTYIDLDNFAVHILDKLADEAEVTVAAKAVRDAISLLVVNRQFHNGTPWTNPEAVWEWEAIGGLSVYMPLRQDERKRGLYNERNLRWAADTIWDEFLGDFWGTNGLQLMAASGGINELPTCESTRNCDGIAFRGAVINAQQQSKFDVHLPIVQQ